MSSKLFSLNTRDFIKGLIVATVAGVCMALVQWLNVPGFDFGAFSWSELIRVALLAGVSYLAKNLLQDESGKVLGSI